jgi:glutamate dehydrogenase
VLCSERFLHSPGPESVNVNNVSKLWDADGVPNFKYLVEGGESLGLREAPQMTLAHLFASPRSRIAANLFVTQSARLQLEKKGVVLFRDSSANKGGVTSSSLEVLAGIALSDDRFLELM